MGADEIDFRDGEFLRCPYSTYDRIRAGSGIARVAGQDAFFVTRYADVIAAARQVDQFSSHRPQLGAGDPEFEAIAAEGYPEGPTLITNDPPEHTGYRRLLSRRFSARAVAEMEPEIRRRADELFDAVSNDGEIEFFSQLAMPLPCHVFGDIIGADESDLAKFRVWADAIADTTSTFITRERALECKRSVVELQHYFAAQVERRRAEPGDDLITELVQARIDDRPLEVFEIVDILRILLAGGVETSASVMTTALFLLLGHPEQLKAVRDDLSLLPQVIEETLRYEAPVLWTPRLVEKDGVALGDVEIPAGSRVLLGWGAANRDPQHHGSTADQFDIHRTGTDHVALGHGVHYCLGAWLGRAEARIALEQLFTRFADVELAEPQEELQLEGMFIRRLPALPLKVGHRVA